MIRWVACVVALAGCCASNPTTKMISEYQGCKVFEVCRCWYDPVYYTVCGDLPVTTEHSQMHGKVRKRHMVDTVPVDPE